MNSSFPTYCIFYCISSLNERHLYKIRPSYRPFFFFSSSFFKPTQAKLLGFSPSSKCILELCIR